MKTHASLILKTLLFALLIIYPLSQVRAEETTSSKPHGSKNISTFFQNLKNKTNAHTPSPNPATDPTIKTLIMPTSSPATDTIDTPATNTPLLTMPTDTPAVDTTVNDSASSSTTTITSTTKNSPPAPTTTNNDQTSTFNPTQSSSQPLDYSNLYTSGNFSSATTRLLNEIAIVLGVFGLLLTAGPGKVAVEKPSSNKVVGSEI